MIAAGVVALIVIAAIDLPGRASNGWSEFKEGGGPGTGTERLGSVAGQNRYQFWSAAVRENETAPLNGTGSGTFEFWWARDGDSDETVRDAHSLYMQTLGELGIVGFAVLILFAAGDPGRRSPQCAPGRRRGQGAARRRPGRLRRLLPHRRDRLDVADPGAAGGDAAARLGAGHRRSPPGSRARHRRRTSPLRVGIAVTAVAAIVAIAIPLASTNLLRQSESDARAGDLEGALEAARSAQNVEGGFAAPRLQEALVLEEMGDSRPGRGGGGGGDRAGVDQLAELAGPLADRG